MPQSELSESERRGRDTISLIGRPEGPNLEYKATVPNSHELSQILGAFANTDGGTLLIGVQEPNKIIGCEAFRTRKTFLEAVKHLSPEIHPEFSAVKTENKWIVSITVKKHAELVMASGGAFARDGKHLSPMKASEIEARLGSAKGELSIHTIAKAITTQTEIVCQLRSELQDANSLKSKLIDYFIGGLIGAVMGAVATLIAG